MRQRILLAKQALEKERTRKTVEQERVVATTRPAVEYTFGVEESF